MRCIFFLLLLTPFFSPAQEFGSRFITVEDGLPQSIVKDIYEDSLGYLWFATGGGLARYDGSQFETFTVDHGLPANEIGALFIDRRQAIWLGTSSGISKFNGRTFKNFNLLDDGQLAVAVWSIAEYGDTIMFLANTGRVGKIYHDSLVSWQPQRSVLQLFSFNNELLVKNLGKDSVEFDYGGEIIKVRKPFHLMGSGFYKEGVLYLSTDRGLVSWKPGAREFTRLLPDLHLAIYATSHDLRYGVGQRDGRITFFTVSETGALSFKTMSEEVRLFSSLLDREGNIWFGTNGSGVLKYYPTRFRKVHSVAKTTEIYLPIYYSSKDKKIFAGTLEDGILIFKQDTIIERINFDKNPNDGVLSLRNRTRSIRSTGDTLWVATHGGLVGFTGNKQTWITSKNGLRSDTIHTLEIGADNTMWIAFFRKGIQLRQNGKFIKHPLLDSTFRRQRIYDLVYAPNQKKMFLSTRNVVLEYNYKTNSIKEIKIPGIGNHILADRMFRGRYLLVSSFGRGLVIVDAMSGTYKTVTTKQGLSSDFIAFLSDDPDGRIWLGTENGINRITLDENLDVKRVEKFGKDDGLEGVRARHEAVMVTDSARYFGTDEGLYSFNDININPPGQNLLHVTNVAIAYDPNEAAKYAGASLPYFNVPANLKLPHDKNHVTITVNLVSKGSRISPRYRYYLQGFDSQWSPFLPTKSITYSNLPPGAYTLLVETDQPNNTRQLAYAFTIEPAVYQRAAFIALAIFLIVGLILLGAYLRVKYSVNQFMKLEHIKSQEQERVRKELASDFHDDLGNYLVRILNYVNQLKLRRPELRHDDVIPKLEESAKILISGTKDFIWSIDLRNNSVESLYCQLKDFGEVIFENTVTIFNTHLDEDVKLIKLPHHFVRQAILIFKEAMTNALKHSEARTGTFSLRRQEDFLRIKFNDDGKGFDVELLNGKSGLNNMALRAKKIGATIYIRSKPGNGSGVELFYPIKTAGKLHGRKSFKDRVS
jgi:signal transduction histidine kinase/ligand-binding sensor domain-containing protein